MTDRSIRLIALAIIWGCSLISLAVATREKEVILFFIFVGTGIWFIGYWLFVATRLRPKQ